MIWIYRLSTEEMVISEYDLCENIVSFLKTSAISEEMTHNEHFYLDG